MSVINITDADAHLPELISVAESEPAFIECRGRRAAVLVSPERYDLMLDASEEVEDIAAFDAAMAKEGGNIPWPK